MSNNGCGREDAGIYQLITELCNRTASNYCAPSKAHKQLASKMRSYAYEIILKNTDGNYSLRPPISDLIMFYITTSNNAKNVAEYKRAIELKDLIGIVKATDFSNSKDYVNNGLRLLMGLSNSVKEDLSAEMYQNPFTFGLLEQMLPKPPRETFGSPQPYSYYPSHIFDLPYSVKQQGDLETKRSQCYTEYTIDSFQSKTLLQDNFFQWPGAQEQKTCLRPMSVASLSSSHASQYGNGSLFCYPRLNGPRDLQLPSSDHSVASNVRVSLASTSVKEVTNVVYKGNTDCGSMDIWELASQVDKDIPDDIWDIASKLPTVKERRLIAAASKEVALWRDMYGNTLADMDVVSEKQLIRHIMYLIIGVETSSFTYSRESNCFYIKENLMIEGVSKANLHGYVSDLLVVGTYYKRLYNFAFNQTLDDHAHKNGMVYEAAREVVRHYLLEFRLKATEIYEDTTKETVELNCMPTLLEIMLHMEPLKQEIETIASIYKVVDTETQACIPKGADLMSYLFNEISMVSHKNTAHTTFNALFSICKVYFKFIERFIFEGELEDRYHEFFIRKDSQYVNCRSKRYWDKGYHISQSVVVPEFLRALAKCILLCGKSLRLLKLCNPSDPLVVLISSDHPTVKCCSSFAELADQQRALAVYRTRCRFVSGEPAAFERILLRREAARKAFAEMASVRQHETMEKIIAERKRLAQLIVAEKQHSLRVLEAAMAEAKASKDRAKQRERRRSQLERVAETAKEQVDSKLRDDERNKIMEYYSKLNMQVEKTQLHMDWKIKRLQLDQSRMQLLSTEERNLKREKMELYHQKSEEVLSMSINSDDGGDTASVYHGTSEKSSYQSIPDSDAATNSVYYDSNTKPQASTDIISALCNVAKNFFIGSKSDTTNCDNKHELDAQGNIVSGDDKNANRLSKTSSAVIGGGIDNLANQIEYLKMRKEALTIKQKVMALEYGQIDEQNNPLKLLVGTKSVDSENNDLTPGEEAQRNKNKVLGTEASKEAVRNKHKVLGVEYNLPAELKETNEPANIAQKEALENKLKVMGVEYNLPVEARDVNEPANFAQEQAIRNKQKILGVEYNLPLEAREINEPANYAQEQAVLNKQKILGVEYNLPLKAREINEPANYAQEQAVLNKQKILGVHYNLPEGTKERKQPANAAQEAAIVNRDRILGEGSLPFDDKIVTIFSARQDDAMKNKHKVMGVEFNLPPEERERPEPITEAQELARNNRLKASNSDISVRSADAIPRSKRLGLTLDLKTHSDTALGAFSLGITPNTGAVTPGDLFPRLDLETPTTADIPHDELLTAGTFTPTSGNSRDVDTANTKNDKEFLPPEDFNFSVLVDDVTGEFQESDSVDHSPRKDIIPTRKQPTINFLDGSYSLVNFDPFGMKDLKLNNKDNLSARMDSDMSTSSFYTHPAKLMEEVQKKPYGNIFAARFAPKDEEDDNKIDCDNIATLTACLQRSVMLPLTYQLEVVNNSILTYFLVNLDMYEHLRSLKDYFFLMDGEFSRSICHNLFSKLVTTINPQELLNFATLHNILDKALGSSISHVHKFSENLSFTMSEPPLSFQHSSPEVLQCLSVTYTVGWPLNIILSQEAILRYAKVFQFLLKMRRISWVLGEDFECLKLSAKLFRDDSRKLLRSPQYISIQLYRHVMASLVRGLDNYIVTTCILTSWREFENDLKKARTLDDLYECHVVYIKKVLFKCLLNNRSTPVMKLLNDLFTVVLKFSRMLKSGEWQLDPSSGRFTHTNFSHLKELFHLFDKLAKYLHKVVMRLMEVGYQRHLVELLTLVNLNGYYDPDRSKDQNNTVQSP